MKQKLLLLAFLACVFSWNAAKAGETEPNNTWNTASTLALNGSNSGAINPAGDIDWWKVTTSGDGLLSVTVTPLSGRNTYAVIYDTLGTIQLTSPTYSTAAFTISADGLAKGTYYVKVYCYFSTDTGSYIISNSLTVPTQANDAEPDSSRATALTLPLNGSKTGHIGYYYDNYRDTVDEYKVTTTGDGLLQVNIASANGQNVYVALYDNDGTTLFLQNYSASSVTISQDGLAAGTYYIKIFCYYSNGFAPYTVSNTLTVPTQANDIEPNNTAAQALTLPLNGGTTGHIGYYYNHYRDTTDWYKLTTTADGLLRLSLTPANGQNVYVTLYDHDGVTVLNSAYTASSEFVSTDGLAAGTYYLSVYCYYTNTGFAPYTLADSLFTPAQANDIEPNNTPAQALTLPLNGSTTGHLGYYYNHYRDTTDWYKVTTNADGQIGFSLTPVNGSNVWVALYDQSGTELLHQAYSASPFSLNTDGLAAGTYYVAVYCYYNSQFTPYILSDTLYTYNSNDPEPNKYFSQAATLPANTTSNGHLGFYYNGVRDTVDTWKVNYTGSGNLSFTLNQISTTAGTTNIWFQVYKDTAASPISSAYYDATSSVINLSSLAQGYYYIKIYEYYNSQFQPYSITPTFTQVNIASVKITKPKAATTCASKGSLTLTCSGSSAPYTVQLYNYGLPYGSPLTIPNTSAFLVSNIPDGSYTATVFGDGATGTAFGKSAIAKVIPKPTTLTTSGITNTKATLHWKSLPCISYYKVQYHTVAGDTAWTTKNVPNNDSLTITRLTAGTTYEWRVASVDSSNKVTVVGAYADSVSFTTTGTPIGLTEEADNSIENKEEAINIYPNPASSQLHIQLGNNAKSTNGNAMLILKNMSGQTVWSTANASTLSITNVDVSRLPAGIYFLQIINADKTMTTEKVVIQR